MMPPPHLRRTSEFSLNCCAKFAANLSNSALSSCFTVVKAMQDAVFLWTNCPRRALPLMMQYGTSFLRHKAGNQQTNSIGSTSCAITTRLADLFSTKVVTWFKPYFNTCGFLLLLSPP